MTGSALTLAPTRPTDTRFKSSRHSDRPRSVTSESALLPIRTHWRTEDCAARAESPETTARSGHRPVRADAARRNRYALKERSLGKRYLPDENRPTFYWVFRDELPMQFLGTAPQVAEPEPSVSRL